MGELASALTRRSGTGTLKTMAKAKAPPAGAAPAEDTPPKVCCLLFDFCLFCVTKNKKVEPSSAPPAAAAPAPSAPVTVASAVRSAEVSGQGVGTPNTMRKKVPGAGPAVPAPAPNAANAANAAVNTVNAAANNGVSKSDLDKLKGTVGLLESRKKKFLIRRADELIKAFREELATFKTQLLSEISALLPAQTSAANAAAEGYYEEEEGY